MKSDDENTIEYKPDVPLPHEAIGETNEPTKFAVISKKTVYIVNSRFDPNGRESVFSQLKKLLLTD